MGFHFGTECEVGEARSKSPTLSRDRYNYHDCLYSMSGKDTFQYKQHQRRSVPNIPLSAVPLRISSLPVLDSSSSTHETTKNSSKENSEAIMRAPLPADLRLGGRHLSYDFSSWIEFTIDELQRPGNYENLKRKSRNSYTAEVPSMQGDQDPTSAGLHSRKYREMPVYADALSAIVSHPYRDELEETSLHRLSKIADWESVKAPAPLFSKPRSEHFPRCSDSTLVTASDKKLNAASRDAFGMQHTTSSGSNKSEDSINSQEERASEATWMKPLSSVPVIGSTISPTVFSPTQSDARPSMPCTAGLFLDVRSSSMSGGQGKLSSMAISGILADITSFIAEFPAKMLCLDTPCIVAIRYDMHAGKTITSACASAASSPASPVSPSSAYARRNAKPKFKISASILRKGSVRGKPADHIGDMLSAPLPASLRAGGPARPPIPALGRSRSNEETVTLGPDRYSPPIGLPSYYRNDLDTNLSHPSHPEPDQSIASEGLRCPDLSAVASIFPESDGWWQSCLLAHLLAYNYLHTLNSTLSFSPSSCGRGRRQTVPDKAARTMGISNIAVIGNEETRYTKVLEDLEKCMVRIMKSMMGKREGVLGLSSPGGSLRSLGEGELALVRALSVVVRGMDV